MTSAAPTATYTLSLHDALPISTTETRHGLLWREDDFNWFPLTGGPTGGNEVTLVTGEFAATELALVSRHRRSEEHTSELQSPMYLVCRLLLENKKSW